MVAVVCDGLRGELIHTSRVIMRNLLRFQAVPWRPDQLPDGIHAHECKASHFRCYGMRTYWADAFTPRQLTAMVTLSDLVREIRADVRRDAIAAGLPESEADAYTRAVATFLALALDRCAGFQQCVVSLEPRTRR
jgi:putative DNA methylase